jgi:hypothetical protein
MPGGARGSMLPHASIAVAASPCGTSAGAARRRKRNAGLHRTGAATRPPRSSSRTRKPRGAVAGFGECRPGFPPRNESGAGSSPGRRTGGRMRRSHRDGTQGSAAPAPRRHHLSRSHERARVRRPEDRSGRRARGVCQTVRSTEAEEINGGFAPPVDTGPPVRGPASATRRRAGAVACRGWSRKPPEPGRPARRFARCSRRS